MSKKSKKTIDVKTYVLDTNILLDDPNSLLAFDNCNIIIPFIVLEEVDKNKDRNDGVGANARQVARQIANIIADQENIKEGVKMVNGSTLYLLTINDIRKENTTVHVDEFEFGDRKKGDNLILEFVSSLTKIDKFSNAVLVTRDILLRCKSKVFNIKSEDYRKDAAIKRDEVLYSGRRTIEIPEDVFAEIQDCECISVKELEQEFGKDFIEKNEIYPNSYIIFTNKTSDVEIPLRFDATKNQLVGIKTPRITNYRPITLEHQMCVDMLTNPDIALCTLTGISGCGKSLAALAAALHQTNLNISGNQSSKAQGKPNTSKHSNAIYDYIIVTKPVHAVGKEIGFLPGSKEEKMAPWIAPITDNLRVLLSKNGRKDIEVENIMKSYFDFGIIEIEAIAYMRGRSINNAFIIIDEAQNCSTHELKTILTRVGENSKIVLTGDLDQIDALHVNYHTSGLTNVIEKFKDSDISAHLTLENGIRSRLATEAAQIL